MELGASTTTRQEEGKERSELEGALGREGTALPVTSILSPAWAGWLRDAMSDCVGTAVSRSCLLSAPALPSQQKMLPEWDV